MLKLLASGVKWRGSLAQLSKGMMSCRPFPHLYKGIHIVHQVMGALHVGAQLGWLQRL